MSVRRPSRASLSLSLLAAVAGVLSAAVFRLAAGMSDRMAADRGESNGKAVAGNGNA
jgi:hypothetical protein